MTRGKVYVITKDGKVYSTTEFNGDMYIDVYQDGDMSNGALMLSKLVKDLSVNFKEVSKEEFEKVISEFNQETFNYQEQLVYEEDLKDIKNWIEIDEKNFKTRISFQDYYNFWFSDYIFIINQYANFIAINVEGRKDLIPKNSITVWNFGHNETTKSLLEISKLEKNEN